MPRFLDKPGPSCSESEGRTGQESAQLDGRAQFLYLAIPAARFYLREQHSLLGTKANWNGFVKVGRQSAANIWADRLSRELDKSEWQLHPRLFRYLDNCMLLAYSGSFCFSVERPASPLQFSVAGPADRGSGLFTASRLGLATREQLVPSPIDLLDDLVTKLQQSRAAATVVTPHWPSRSWHQLLTEMAEEVLLFPAGPHLFLPRGRSDGVGRARWSLAVFRVPCQAGCT